MADPRVPNSSTPWQLWHIDIFDSDSAPFLQASGGDFLRGLHELWLCTLREAVLDNGSASFSRFHLTWGNSAISRIEVMVNPFHNFSLIKLRQWANLSPQDQETGSTIRANNLEQGTVAVINRLAKVHYDLLCKSDRWKAAAIDWSAEARELLARVESMADPSELWADTP